MKFVFPRAQLLALLFVFFSFDMAPAAAQSLVPPSAPAEPVASEVAPPSPNDVRELIRLLDDERIKAWLEKGAEEARSGDADGDQELGKGLRTQLSAIVDRTRSRLRLLATTFKNFGQIPTRIAQEWGRNLSGGETVRSLTYVLVFLFIGGGLEWLYRQYTDRRLLRLQLTTPASLSARIRAAGMRALLVFGGLLVFAAGSIGGFLAFDWSPYVEVFVLNLLILVIVLRIISTLSMFVLAPRVRELRLAPFDGPFAKQLHRLLIIWASVVAIALSLADTFSQLSGMGNGGAGLQETAFAIKIGAGIVVLGSTLYAIWRVSTLVVSSSQKREAEIAERSKSVTGWRIYLSALVIISFILWLLAANDVMWTVLILGSLPATLAMVKSWTNHFFDDAEAFLMGERKALMASDGIAGEEAELAEEVPDGEEENSSDDLTVERRPYDVLRAVTNRFFRIVIIISSILLVLAAWGTDIFTLADSPAFYGKAVSVVIDLIIALLIADLIWVWAKSSIDRRLADYKPPEGPEAPGPEARMATLLPLLRVILSVTLVVLVGLSVLSSMGVNIAPLIAGAGVLGVAIGFGAQSLVKDIVSGIFFLIDDAFRIGEYIEVGNLRGVVESMSIRSLRVRHHLGAVHTIPFGELTSLSNYSRDWVILKMEFRVPFETDIKLVKKIVKKIGAEMIEDPLYKDSFLEPLKSQGVRRMEEFNMVVSVKFMSKPGEQWIIRRDAYQKIVNAFEAHGIRLAERNVKVEVISDKPLTEAEKEAVIGAAQDSIENQATPPPPADEP